MRILVIEDDLETAEHIRSALEMAGHQIGHAANGSAGLHATREASYDLIIVDRMLPGLDGLTLVELIRDHGSTIPVLFLSALDGVDDRVKGLNAGGDDYLVKPFSLRELEARVAALGRRNSLSHSQFILRVSDLTMDLISHQVTRAYTPIDLLPREWALLEYLLRNIGRVVTKRMLLEKIWDFHFDPRTNVVETHVSRLRQKIDKSFSSELIHNVRGVGYMIREPV